MHNSVSPKWIGALLCGAVLVASGVAAVQPPPLATVTDAQSAARAVLEKRCVGCHGAARSEGGLRLDTWANLGRGGNHGLAVRAGDVDGSPLIQAVRYKAGLLQMPPTGKLPDDEIHILEEWARSLKPVAAGPQANALSHWAYVPPVRPLVPKVRRTGWVRNPIDAFLSEEHERRGLTPVGPAEKGALLRRVSVDLTGLPPTRKELLAYLSDPSPLAYERAVDRLLATPQHGERWARHWLDVWRYSDWYGRRMVPDVWNSAPQVWRWRDWTVKSLNRDTGYDRIVQSMLAADELTPGDRESVVATGYLVRNWYALNPNQWMRDNAEHTGKAFLGLTFNCAHCHDHKYDPITQEDYFRLRAVFEPIQVRQDRWEGEADPGPFQKYDYSVLRKIQRLGSVSVFDEKLDAKTFMYHGGDERNRMEGREPVAPGPPRFLTPSSFGVKPVALPTASWYPGSQATVRRAELSSREQTVQELERALAGADGPQARANSLSLRAAEADLAAFRARVAADDARLAGRADAGELGRRAADEEQSARVLKARADLASAEGRRAGVAASDAAAIKKADAAVDAARKALAAAEKTPLKDYTRLGPEYPKESSGRRAAFALWLTDRKNPLTARVAVNHIWRWHFGKGLVESVFDFGRNGRRPTHPKLLDWLAVEFMDHGWSMKHLHRLIVTSNAYRMSSVVGERDASRLAVDRDNAALWHFPSRRMEAEAVRDSLLHLAGELDLTAGGEPVENKDSDASRRRGLYFACYPEDGGHPLMLSLFDAPDPCDAYRRSESIVPQQALALTNSDLAICVSRSIAARVANELGSGDDAAFVAAAYQHVLSRLPGSVEAESCVRFLARQRAVTQTAGSAPSSKAPPVSPEVRARESLVRVLINHHEFLTVR